MEPLVHAWSVRPGPGNRHFQGGPPPPGAVCADCGRPLHLVWDLDPTDPALTSDPGWPVIAALLGGADRLPVVFCFRCWDTAYRLQGAEVVPIASDPIGTAHPQTLPLPYSDFPAPFPRASLTLTSGSGGSQLGGPMHRLQEPLDRCQTCDAEAMVEIAVIADDGLPLFRAVVDSGVAQLGLAACTACGALQVYSESA